MFRRKKKPKPIDWDGEFQKLIESETQTQTFKNDLIEITIGANRQMSLTFHIKGELLSPMVIAAINNNFDVNNFTNFEKFMEDFLEAGGLFFSILDFLRDVSKNNLSERGIFIR